MSIEGPGPRDLAHLGGVAAANLCKMVALGLPDEAENIYQMQLVHDGGRALVAGLANIAVQAVTDLLAVEAERRAATGQPGDPPSVIDTLDSISARYAMSFQASAEIDRLTD